MKFSRFEQVLFLGVAAAFCVWIAASLSWPMGRDQGILAWVGSVIISGGLPYKDAWEVKGPGALYAFALSQWLFGHNMWGIRAFDAGCQIIGIAAVAYSAKLVFDARTAAISGVIVALLYMNEIWWCTAQPDGWVEVLLAVGVALIAAGVRRVSLLRTAASGFCLGLCVTVKPLYGLLLMMLAPVLIRAFKSSRKFGVQSTLAAMTGFSIPVLITATWFAVRGGLFQLFNVEFMFTSQVHARMHHLSLFGHVENLYLLLSEPAFLICLLIALSGLYTSAFSLARRSSVIILWLAGCAICLVAQSKYYQYQFLPLLGPLAIFSAVGIQSLDQHLQQSSEPRAFWRMRASSVISMVLALFLLHNPIYVIRDWGQYRTGKITTAKYEEEFVGPEGKEDFSFGTIRNLSAYLRQHTAVHDTVEVWGWDPLINFLSDRATPTRFGYIYPLIVGSANPFEASYREQFLQRLRSEPPTYFIVPDHNTNNLMPSSSEEIFEDFPLLHTFVLANYRLETKMDNYRVWRRTVPAS